VAEPDALEGLIEVFCVRNDTVRACIAVLHLPDRKIMSVFPV